MVRQPDVSDSSQDGIRRCTGSAAALPASTTTFTVANARKTHLLLLGRGTGHPRVRGFANVARARGASVRHRLRPAFRHRPSSTPLGGARVEQAPSGHALGPTPQPHLASASPARVRSETTVALQGTSPNTRRRLHQMDSRRQTPCQFHGTVLDPPDTRQPRVNLTQTRGRPDDPGIGYVTRWNECQSREALALKPEAIATPANAAHTNRIGNSSNQRKCPNQSVTGR